MRLQPQMDSEKNDKEIPIKKSRQSEKLCRDFVGGVEHNRKESCPIQSLNQIALFYES